MPRRKTRLKSFFLLSLLLLRDARMPDRDGRYNDAHPGKALSLLRRQEQRGWRAQAVVKEVWRHQSEKSRKDFFFLLFTLRNHHRNGGIAVT